MPSPKTGFEYFGSGALWMLIPRGMTMLRIYFPDHRDFGFIMAGMDTLPSQPGTHGKMF
jgi:hypothetical protein